MVIAHQVWCHGVPLAVFNSALAIISLYLAKTIRKGHRSQTLISGTIDHRFLPGKSKLKEYGCQSAALKLIQNYHSGRYQTTKVNNVYSSSSKIIAGFPQGLMLRPVLSNVFLNYLFLHAKKL